MMKEKEVILETGEGLFEKVNMDLFQTKDGRLFVKETAARSHASTHKRCTCGEVMPKFRIRCDKCSAITRADEYKKKPYQEWDGKTPLYLYDDDKYFFDESDIEDYLEENELEPEDLQLVICTPNYLRTIDYDLWEDVLAEDQELPDWLIEKVEELNALIKTKGSISWSPGRYRTDYKR